MKTLPIPATALQRLKHGYDALMCDDLPMDFDKVSELIQAAGAVVRAGAVARVVEVQATEQPRMKRVTVNGTRYVKAA
jgi:hypothetical protein